MIIEITADDSTFWRENVEGIQSMPPPDLEIVEIVRGRDLHRAGALLGVGVFVGHDRDGPSDEGQDGAAADQIAVALVVRVDGDARVAQHRLGPRGRNRDETAWLALDRIADVPEVTFDLDLLHLKV